MLEAIVLVVVLILVVGSVNGNVVVVEDNVPLYACGVWWLRNPGKNYGGVLVLHIIHPLPLTPTS